MNETNGKSRQVDFNTVLNVIVIGAMTWVGYSIQEGTKKLSAISERMAVIETSSITKVEQLNRMELELNHQRQALFELQMDVSKLKGTTHP